MIAALIARDLRRGFTGAAWLPIAFFLLVATLMPFAIGPDAKLLARIGPGALWIAALTAALLPVERLLRLPTVTLDDASAARFVNGVALQLELVEGRHAVHGAGGLIGIGHMSGGRLQPEKVLPMADR